MENKIPIINTPEGDTIENTFTNEKEYIIEINKKRYIFKINSDNKYINFIIKQKDNLIFFEYKNKCKPEKIIEILKLKMKSYNNLNEIIYFLDKAYNENKIIIKFDEKNNIFNINFKLTNDIQKYNSNIILKKEEIKNEEKFYILFNEIKLLKQDLIKKDKIIDDALKKIKYLNGLKIENEKIIKDLKNKVINNKNILKINENEIQNLKNEFLTLKDKVFGKNKNNIIKGKTNKEKENNKQNLSEIDYKIEKINETDYKNYDFLFKIIFLGACCTGKSTITQKYMRCKELDVDAHSFPHQFFSNLKINDIPIRIYIRDPPGQERFQSIISTYFPSQDLFVFMYKDRNTFEWVKDLIKDAKVKKKSNSHCVLVSSRINRDIQREVSIEEVDYFSKKEGIDYFTEVCLEDYDEIDNLFFEIAKILFKNRKIIK